MVHNTSLQATRDYNIGEPAEPSAVAAAASLGCEMPAGFAAKKFDYEGDTVAFDLVLVMDKFTAGDVMREVFFHSSFGSKKPCRQYIHTSHAS